LLFFFVLLTLFKQFDSVILGSQTTFFWWLGELFSFVDLRSEGGLLFVDVFLSLYFLVVLALSFHHEVFAVLMEPYCALMNKVKLLFS